jgi:hypothetical protein
LPSSHIGQISGCGFAGLKEKKFPISPITIPISTTTKQRYKVNLTPKKRQATKIAVIDVAGVETRNARIGPKETPFFLKPIATGMEPKQQRGRIIPAMVA